MTPQDGKYSVKQWNAEEQRTYVLAFTETPHIAHNIAWALNKCFGVNDGTAYFYSEPEREQYDPGDTEAIG